MDTGRFKIRSTRGQVSANITVNFSAKLIRSPVKYQWFIMKMNVVDEKNTEEGKIQCVMATVI